MSAAGTSSSVGHARDRAAGPSRGLAAWLATFLDPDVDRRLLDGERVIDEVDKHWATSLLPTLGLVACIPVFVLMVPAGDYFWVPLAVGLVLATWCLWLIHVEHMDRFVITNMRVFRVHGVFNQHMATMPMTRILDITIEQPFLGKLFGFGHFVFETAAQDQGLREITYVSRPEQRDKIIESTIQAAGLRTNVHYPGLDEHD